MKDEVQDLEQSLKESEGVGIGTAAETIDRSAIKSQINRLQKQLAVHSAPKLSGRQKDEMVGREKELEDFFEKGLPSKYEMDHPAKCPGAVRKHMTWLKRCEKSGLVKEYRQIQRTLRPGEERSIEQLRQDGGRSKWV